MTDWLPCTFFVLTLAALVVMLRRRVPHPNHSFILTVLDWAIGEREDSR